MFKYISFLVIPFLLVFSLQAQAEESIGVVDWRRAVFQSDAAKEVDSKMKAENKVHLNRMRELEGKLETNQKKLTKDRDLLGESELKELETSFQQDLSEFNLLRSKLQEIQAQTEADFIVAQQQRIDQAMEKIAAKYKLTLILDRQVVVYGLKTRELTQELTDALNSAQ